MKALILVNRAAGGRNLSPEELELLFCVQGVQAQAHWIDSVLAQEALGAVEKMDMVVAAGGDGTVSGVAARMVGSPVPLGVLPTGTLNHFAKDLKIPLELQEAVDCVLRGHVTQVDVGEVNGRSFINNSSLGAYPGIVEEREQQRQQGRAKWPATLLATYEMLRRRPLIRARLKMGDNDFFRTTPFVFVGNNQYAMDLFSIGARKSLQEGILSVYTARCSSAWGLARVAVHALLNRLEQSTDFDALAGPRLQLDMPGADSVRVALDGELQTMRLPLVFASRPSALRVITPV